MPDGSGATPRLAVTASGAVLLAFRDSQRDHAGTLRVAVRRRGAFGPARAVGCLGSRVALAATGAGAVLGWIAPARRCGAPQARPRVSCAPRALRAVALDASGRRRGDAITVAADAGSWPRLVAGANGSVLASWISPARGRRPHAAATRLLGRVALRALGPRRSVPAGIAITPTIALSSDGDALAAFAPGSDGDGYVASVARSLAGGPWSAAQALHRERAIVTLPRLAFAPGGGATAVFGVDAAGTNGMTRHRLLLSHAPPGGRFGPPEVVAETSLLRPVELAARDDRLLIGWAGAGLTVTERVAPDRDRSGFPRHTQPA